MFTGIIETTGRLKKTTGSGANRQYWIDSAIAHELKIDQSVSHNGVCLTVDAIEEDCHRVTAVPETLAKTNLADWKPGDYINIERCLQASGRLDGHFVQGHVDTTGLLLEKKDLDGSCLLNFQFPEQFAPLIIEKGSIALNGISLTAFNVTGSHFSVAIIPYTFEHTNLKYIREGDAVNLEFDILGKYLLRWAEIQKQSNLFQ
jgi:riboflavin synthase